jgi:hypothetical protein
MQYLKKGATLPVPLNIIPAPKSFVCFYRKFLRLFNKKEPKLSEINDLPSQSTTQRSQMNHINKNKVFKIFFYA